MPLVPSNVNFQIGDILTATQYNETHNTTAKLALEDNSRIVLPNSSAPTNIANGHWVLGAIAGEYINFNGVGVINTPSVFLYEYSTETWLVYPLNSAVINDTTLTSYYTYNSYTANQDFVYYVNSESTNASYRVPFIYKCILSASPTQSPETYPSKWARAGVYINESTILSLSEDVQTLSQNVTNLTIRVVATETSITNLVNEDIAINLRIDSVENLITTLGINELTDRVTILESNQVSVDNRLVNVESDITDLNANLIGLESTVMASITSLTLRVGIVERVVSSLESTVNVLNANMTLMNGEFESIKETVASFPAELEALETRIGPYAPLITAEHITILDNTNGINTGDQDLSNLSPLVHIHVESDITDLDKYTQAEVNGLLDTKAESYHTHVEADIINLDKYTKAEVDFLIQSVGGDLTEAPIDGKQYARQDGTWAEVVTGSTDVVTTDTVEVYNPDKSNDENGYAYYAGNTFVSYVNGDSLDPQFTTESLYRCYSNAYIGETPETNPDKWVYQGSSVVVSNDNTGITVVRSVVDLKAITGYKHDDSVISLESGAVYYYDSVSNLGEVPNDNTTGLGSWVSTPTNNVFETAKPLLNTSGSTCTIIAGREIIHSIAEGITTLNVVSSIGGTFTKVAKTLVVLDNTDNSNDVALTWSSNVNEYWTDNKPAYLNANSIIKVEVIVYGASIVVFNPYFIQNTGSSSWTTIYVDSAVTTTFNAVPYTVYLVDATTAPITAYLPDSTSGDLSEYKFVLNKDTHKLTLTTIGGTQLIGDYTSQIIPTLKGSLDVKSTGSGYDITDDNRSTINVLELTANRDFGTDNFENNFLYLIKPNGGSIALSLPEATNITGGIAIQSRFQLEGEGDFTISTPVGLIGDRASQTVSVSGTGFDIVWYESKYYIQNDTRPKTTSATVTTYPMDEFSTITDTVTGTFFRQRCATTECPGFNNTTATEIPTTITAAAGGTYQCTNSSIIQGSMIGTIPVGNIEIFYNGYRTGSVNVEVYVAYYKRTDLGVETLIGTSSVGTFTSNSITQLRLVAQHIAFDVVETDYLVVRTFARKATTGTDPVLYSVLEGPNPTRSTMEIGASSIAHNTLAGRGAVNAHPATAIQLNSGTNLETYLANNSPVADIISSTTWDGTLFNIDLSSNKVVHKTVNNLVTSLTLGLSFGTDAATKSRSTILVIDNSTNTAAITTLTFNGTWLWPLGVQPSGIAAGAKVMLQVLNVSVSSVLPTYYVIA